MNKSIDFRETAQLDVSVHGIDMEFNITEELAAFMPMKGTITNAELHKEIRCCQVCISQYKKKKTGRIGNGWIAKYGR
jgi:hypothetical protein